MDSLPEHEHSVMGSVGATRKLMEEVARESVAAMPNVSVRSGSFVSGLSLAGNGDAIDGVLPCSTAARSCIAIESQHKPAGSFCVRVAGMADSFSLTCEVQGHGVCDETLSDFLGCCRREAEKWRRGEG